MSIEQSSSFHQFSGSQKNLWEILQDQEKVGDLKINVCSDGFKLQKFMYTVKNHVPVIYASIWNAYLKILI